MNALLSTLATAAFAANPPAPAGPAPAITIGSINPTTTLLVTPATGQAVLAIEVNGVLLLTGPSPAIALPLTAPNVAGPVDMRLLTGLR